jgi:anti-sigma B factor antagonist
MTVQDQLLIDVRQDKGTAVLSLRGELDLASAPLLQAELDNSRIASASTLVLDLEELKFIDSTGLRVLLTAHKHSQGRGQEFALTQGSPQVQRLLSITGVGEHLRIIAPGDEPLV